MLKRLKKRGKSHKARDKQEFKKIHDEVESLKAELHSLAYEQKNFEDILSGATKKYYAEKHIDRMFGQELRTIFPTNAFVITLAVILMVGGVFYVAFSNPEITGAAISGTAKVVGHKAVATSAGLFMVIIILGLALHGVEYRHRHKHDKYKHPKMLE